MGSPLTHASVLILAKFFPLSPAALLIASQMPDIEAPVMFFRSLIAQKRLSHAYLNTEQGIFHTLAGCFITVPLTIFLLALLSVEITSMVLLSAVIGVLSHLLLDLPGHRDFLLLWPKKYKTNPFRFKTRLPLIERFYPWRKKEKEKDFVISEYNWWVVSHIFVIIALLLYFLA